MANGNIYFTQIASIVLFIGALFVLYRVLVSKKDATIQLLKERIDDLKDQLSKAQENTPDKLAKRLSDRIHILNDELERLSEDKETNEELIKHKEEDLKLTQEDLVRLQDQLEEARDIAGEFLCPFCKAPMAVREYHTRFYGDQDYETEVVSFNCGYTTIDGKEEHPCGNKTES